MTLEIASDAIISRAAVMPVSTAAAERSSSSSRYYSNYCSDRRQQSDKILF